MSPQARPPAPPAHNADGKATGPRVQSPPHARAPPVNSGTRGLRSNPPVLRNCGTIPRIEPRFAERGKACVAVLRWGTRYWMPPMLCVRGREMMLDRGSRAKVDSHRSIPRS